MPPVASLVQVGLFFATTNGSSGGEHPSSSDLLAVSVAVAVAVASATVSVVGDDIICSSSVVFVLVVIMVDGVDGGVGIVDDDGFFVLVFGIIHGEGIGDDDEDDCGGGRSNKPSRGGIMMPLPLLTLMLPLPLVPPEDTAASTSAPVAVEVILLVPLLSSSSSLLLLLLSHYIVSSIAAVSVAEAGVGVGVAVDN